MNPDIREDLLTPKQFRSNCDNYIDWALFTPPDRFMFHHYDEPATNRWYAFDLRV